MEVERVLGRGGRAWSDDGTATDEYLASLAPDWLRCGLRRDRNLDGGMCGNDGKGMWPLFEEPHSNAAGDGLYAHGRLEAGHSENGEDIEHRGSGPSLHMCASLDSILLNLFF